MPDRILRDELLNSERWLLLPRNTHRLAFVCLIPAGDALGNLEGSDGHLWRLWRDPLRLDSRASILEILEALVAADMVRLYESKDGKRLIHIPRYKQRLRYLGRLNPLSPWTTNEERQRLAGNSPGDGQVSTRRAPGAHRTEVKRSEVEEKRSEVEVVASTSPVDNSPLGQNPLYKKLAKLYPIQPLETLAEHAARIVALAANGDADA